MEMVKYRHVQMYPIVLLQNWAQRMGHGNIKDKDLRGENISTVGVDIGDLVLQKGSKKVVFRTWDFGGQVRYGFQTKISLIYCTSHSN